MGEFVASVSPIWGIDFGDKQARIRNASGSLRDIGDILQFDVLLTVATNYKIGDPNSAWAVGVAPVVGEITRGFLGLVAEPIPPGELGLVWLWGDRLLARFDPGNDPGALGLPISFGGATFTLDGTAIPAGSKIFGMSRESTATKPPGSLFRITWNGIYGLGKG